MSQQSNNDGSGDTLDKTKLIVNYIPQNTSEEDLMGIFMQVGDLESIKIMRHPRTGYSYGYGFVKYVNEGSAERAIEALNGFPYRNKTLKVSYSRPPSQVTKDSNLYISNLPKDFTEDHLVSLFSKFGEIIQKNLLKDKATGIPRGVAFVRYARGDEAQAAIAELDGHKLDNTAYPLSVRVADDHTKQRVHLLENQNICSQRQNCYQQQHLRGAMMCGSAPQATGGQAPNRGGPNARTLSSNHHHRYMGGGDFHHLFGGDMLW